MGTKYPSSSFSLTKTYENNILKTAMSFNGSWFDANSGYKGEGNGSVGGNIVYSVYMIR